MAGAREHDEERASDGQGTVEALLRAGRELFARRGYDGASVRAITARAGANLGAITYHFGSKRAFYDRVVEASIGPLAERVVAVAKGDGAPLDRAEAVVRVFFEYLRDNPDLPYLMLQELAVGRLPPAAAIGPILRVHAALTDLVRAGQADGSIRPGPAKLMSLGILSQALHFNLMRVPLREIMGLDTSDPEVWATLVEQAVAFVRGGLASGSGRSGV